MTPTQQAASHIQSNLKKGQVVCILPTDVDLPVDQVKATITGRCIFNPKITYTTQPIPLLHLVEWIAGTLIQRALPTTSSDDREFLTSGISPTSWDETFKDKED
jgi:hypothetical protein